MKKFFLALSLLTTVTLMAARPTTELENPKAVEVFQRQFAGAQNVMWSTVNEFSKVSFTWAGHRTEAYFNRNAELVAAIRSIFYSQLPLAVVRAAELQFREKMVLEVRELTNEEGTTYSFLLEKKGKRYKAILSSTGHLHEMGKAE
jgi:hypothetical protein